MVTVVLMSLRALEPAATLFHCHRRPAVCFFYFFFYFLFLVQKFSAFTISTESQEAEAVWLHHRHESSTRPTEERNGETV